MWSDLGSNEMVITHPKPTPPTPRMRLSLANFADKYIFVIAGANLDTYAKYASVDIYTIVTNTWSQAPPLNEARSDHSSCVAGDTICVFGGQGNRGNLNSMEILKLDKFFSGILVAWEIIEFT